MEENQQSAKALRMSGRTWSVDLKDQSGNSMQTILRVTAEWSPALAEWCMEEVQCIIADAITRISDMLSGTD